MYCRTSLAFYPLGMKVLMSQPDMMLFFDHVAGRMVLAALLQAASADTDHLRAAVPMPKWATALASRVLMCASS